MTDSTQSWAIGDTLRIGRWMQLWTVREVVERGLVISTHDKDDHRHLIEWDTVATATRIA